MASHNASEFISIEARIREGSPIDQVHAVGRMLALDTHHTDVSKIYPLCLSVPSHLSHNYVRARRFVGMLSEKYMKKTKKTNIVVQAVCHDFESTNALTQGIAVRQAGRLASDKTVSLLVPIILRGASSNDPYVRKTAAMAILNLFNKKKSYLEQFNLIPILKNLVEDSNANVAANAVSALYEIGEAKHEYKFTPNTDTINNLLVAIDQATEWSQVQVLDFVATCKPESETSARGIIARVITRLNHANAAVVVSAIRCSLNMNAYIMEEAKIRSTLSKVVLPLVSLMNNIYTVQFISLRAIYLLLQNFTNILSSEVSIFFCKYDDPTYLKLAKLDVIIALVNTSNVGKVLEELSDYAQQTDMEFSRKSIRALGKICCDFESAAKFCVDKLVVLINTKVQFVVQECIIVSVDIFRRYPKQYEGIIPIICSNLTDNLDDHRARAAMLWIIGEFASKITNAGEILDALFLDEFEDAPSDVQLSMLTTVVKFYLVDPENADAILQRVFQIATEEIDNPDVRDRAFMYLGLLQEHPEEAKAIVFPEQQPMIHIDRFSIDLKLAHDLIPYIGTLSILYNKKPEQFVPMVGSVKRVPRKSEIQDNEDLSDEGESSLDRLKLPQLVKASQECPIDIKGAMQRIGDVNSFVIRFTNYDESPFEITDIAFQKNIFGIAPGTFEHPPSIQSRSTMTIAIPLIFKPEQLVEAIPSSNIDIAILSPQRNTIFFDCPVSLDMILDPNNKEAKMTKEQFVNMWNSIPSTYEIKDKIQNARIDTIELAKHKLTRGHIFYSYSDRCTGYFSAITIKGDNIGFHIEFEMGSQVTICAKSVNIEVTQIVLNLLRQAFT